MTNNEMLIQKLYAAKDTTKQPNNKGVFDGSTDLWNTAIDQAISIVEAHFRKHQEAKVNNEMTDKASDILDNEPEMIDQIAKCIRNMPLDDYSPEEIAEDALYAILPYLRTTEPVVSSEISVIGGIKDILNKYYVYDKASGSRFLDVDKATQELLILFSTHLFKFRTTEPVVVERDPTPYPPSTPYKLSKATKSAIAAMGATGFTTTADKTAGSATRKDAGAVASTSDGMSEISLLGKLESLKSPFDDSYVVRNDVLEIVHKHIAASVVDTRCSDCPCRYGIHCRTTEPVSLKECAEEVQKLYGKGEWPDFIYWTKAVLEAAGVPYHE